MAIGYRVGACGDYSTAMGYRATTDTTLHGLQSSGGSSAACNTPANYKEGSFVFGDQSTNNFVAASANNEVTFRSAGGFRIFTNAEMNVGVTLSASGSAWNVVSDRRLKHELRPVDGEQLLGKIAAMPLDSWEYVAQPGVRHMGPMAQDFRAAFGLGDSETHITTSDIDGVSLTAIEALDARTRELASAKPELQAQRQQIDELAERLRKLETLLAAR